MPREEFKFNSQDPPPIDESAAVENNGSNQTRGMCVVNLLPSFYQLRGAL